MLSRLVVGWFVCLSINKITQKLRVNAHGRRFWGQGKIE